MSYIPLMSYDEALNLVSGPALPEETRSYKPVANARLIERVRAITSDYLGKEPVSYGAKLNGTGDQMFGSILYANGSEDMQMQIGFRNSYDKSMPVGLTAGASVIVCANGMFVGEIMTVRKHTTNVWRDIEAMVEKFCETIVPNYERIQYKRTAMKANRVSDNGAAQCLGEMFMIDEVLTTPMMNIAKKEWLKPSHDEFNDRNAWSLYNACTEALKKSHPSEMMERHQRLDGFFEKRGLYEDLPF